MFCSSKASLPPVLYADIAGTRLPQVTTNGSGVHERTFDLSLTRCARAIASRCIKALKRRRSREYSSGVQIFLNPRFRYRPLFGKTHAGGTSRLQDDGSVRITPTVDGHFDARGGSRPWLAYTIADIEVGSAIPSDTCTWMSAFEGTAAAAR